jgi:hypothetical protein
MLHVFHQDVAYVAVAIHICCKRMFQMFHMFFRRILQQVFHVVSVHVSSVSACMHPQVGHVDSCVRA